MLQDAACKPTASFKAVELQSQPLLCVLPILTTLQHLALQATTTLSLAFCFPGYPSTPLANSTFPKLVHYCTSLFPAHHTTPHAAGV